MFFKNLIFYRFTKPFTLDNEQLEEKLAEALFKPCGANDLQQLGWAAPLGKHSEQLVHVCQNYWMVCLQQQDRILPSSVVNEQVEEKVNEIEEQQHRKVTRKEKTEIKEQVTTVLMPQSFTRNKRFFAYIDAKKGLLVVNSSSAKVADELTSFLRKTIGSLPVRIPAVKSAPSSVMTDWATNNTTVPGGFEVGEQCELKSTGEEKGSIKYKSLELDGEKIEQHVADGMQVDTLALCWRESISFVMSSNLMIKTVKFGDLVQEKLDDTNAEDAASKFDAGFSIMAMEFDKFIPEVLEAFGGEDLDGIAK